MKLKKNKKYPHLVRLLLNKRILSSITVECFSAGEGMNNIFLYAVKPSSAYQAVESFVRTCQLNGRLIVLPPGTQFTSPLCLQLRSNDLIILFAQDENDIDELLLLRDEYESFRIILIIEKEEGLTSSNYLHLSPRFISFLDKNIDELSEYLKSVVKINLNFK